ncbi:MAG: hypothetical protein OEZ43_07925 [Gammaproteobacteria bacterium]|nr:hypothetical protein [Gammaproteobacteria bacterium]
MAHSNYSKEDFHKLLEQLKRQQTAPDWLIQCLAIAATNIDHFPFKEDDNRYVVEFIYPH